jgi:hypothetical protein
MDVSTEILIRRPRAEVASGAADPARAPLWYKNIKLAQWRSDPPLRVGSKVAFTARFLRRQLEYTYEIMEYVPAERLVMRTSEGPFPMETTYSWSDEGPFTRMRLRNRGGVAGMARVFDPFLAVMVRRENAKDLRRLKAILELRR